MRLWSTRRGRVVFASTVVAAGVVVAGGLAVASPSAPSNTYTGCLVHGILVNVAVGQAPKNQCPTGATQVQWNKTGPRGPRGEQGPPGTVDLQVTMRHVTRTVTVPPLEDTLPGDPTADAVALCLSGEVVLSGGVTGYGPDIIPLKMIRSGPVGGDPTSGWGVTWVNPTAEPVTATVRMTATCAPGSMAIG